ncbi:chalcone isomerase family protein [Chitinimonas sp.]|uniref:chalcone isomerase family protein n=1 Tax=Chitinimonas sp. TaxID=1934313 RepID=UPI0035B27BE8
MNMIKLFASLLLASLVALPVQAAIQIEGVSFEESLDLEGSKLQLNGVGWRKRGYNKVDATGLYLPQKASTLDEVEKMAGPKRIQLIMLQEITGSTASRYFLSDFEVAASQDEFHQLITETFQMGAIYNSLSKLKKGDVVNIDIIPGKGLTASINGTPLLVPDTKARYINSELMGRIFLRMYVGGRTPTELRQNLLGQSKSMREAR